MSDTTEKPRIRVTSKTSSMGGYTRDSFANFRANLGYGTGNISSSGTYGFNPITRNHTLLEWMYRGSWIVQTVVDSFADDMTRMRTRIKSDLKPDVIDSLNTYINARQIWQQLNSAIKWSRLYGGALAVIQIEGQKPDTPLRLQTVGKGQFKGLLVLDRWMVWPHLNDLVTEPGPHFGTPRYYDTVADAQTIPHMRIHHSRVIRFDGVQLPYWQWIAENMWGLSVIEPMFDRLVAFDSATTGAAQLVYRAHLRTYYVDKLRELIATGGKMYQAFLQQMDLIRSMQSIEGMTILDSTDKFETQQYAFSGLDSVLIQFGQQISGACKIPLVRLFGQSPAGLSATGESDLRNYYDAVKCEQEARLYDPVAIIYDLAYRSLTGVELPKGFSHIFNPLWQMSDTEKAGVASSTTSTVLSAFGEGIISQKTTLKELRQSAEVTGIWTNITDEDIEAADSEPPPPPSAEGGPNAAQGGPPQEGEPDSDEHEGEEVLGEGGEPGIPGHDDVLPAIQGGDPDEDLAQLLQEEDLDDQADNHTWQEEPLEEEGDVNTSRNLLNAQTEGDLQSKTLPGFRLPTRKERRAYARKHALRLLTQDSFAMRDIHGITCVIETPKGTRRVGYGWAVQMPADYGYISGTSSAEGPMEQMDCYIGPDPKSSTVYVIEQVEPDRGLFDEHKVMLGYPSVEAAKKDYRAAFADGRGQERIGHVLTMSIKDFKRWLQRWNAGRQGPRTSAAQRKSHRFAV